MFEGMFEYFDGRGDAIKCFYALHAYKVNHYGDSASLYIHGATIPAIDFVGSEALYSSSTGFRIGCDEKNHYFDSDTRSDCK